MWSTPSRQLLWPRGSEYKTLLWQAVLCFVASELATIFCIFPWSPPTSLSHFFATRLRSERCNHLQFWNGKLPQRKLGCESALFPHPDNIWALFTPILMIFKYSSSQNTHKHTNNTIISPSTKQPKEKKNNHNQHKSKRQSQVHRRQIKWTWM